MCGSKLENLPIILQKQWEANKTNRQQPWSTYALHFATFTSLAFVFDPLLLVSGWYATADWEPQNQRYAFWAQFIFIFGFTKVVKLMGLFIKNPFDLIFWPVSVVFGYFHGLIKLYALVTLNMVSGAVNQANARAKIC